MFAGALSGSDADETLLQQPVHAFLRVPCASSSGCKARPAQGEPAGMETVGRQTYPRRRRWQIRADMQTPAILHNALEALTLLRIMRQDATELRTGIPEEPHGHPLRTPHAQPLFLAILGEDPPQAGPERIGLLLARPGILLRQGGREPEPLRRLLLRPRLHDLRDLVQEFGSARRRDRVTTPWRTHCPSKRTTTVSTVSQSMPCWR